MGIISETVKVKIGSRNFKYYKNLGYNFEHIGEEIEVKVEHLPKYTKEKVLVRCDMCNKNTMFVTYCDYNKVIENTGNYVCKECSKTKQHNTMLERYGVAVPFQSESVKNKIKKTNIDRYGVENYSKTKEYIEKMSRTMEQKYGVRHALQSKKFQEAYKNTCLERYGKDYQKIFVKKSSDSYYKNTGYLNPFQSVETKEKAAKSYYKNSSQICSRQQFYIYSLFFKYLSLSVELNFSISYFNADICFPEEKIVFEVDFGGHNLPVKTGKISQEEFNQKELVRDKIIKREGYKIIRLISRKDYLPSDEILLQLLSNSREYFSKTSHTWISWDIDNSKMINAENKDLNGSFFNFGELRKIKKSDLSDSENCA